VLFRALIDDASARNKAPAMSAELFQVPFHGDVIDAMKSAGHEFRILVAHALPQTVRR
jgi:hypothetical protein